MVLSVIMGLLLGKFNKFGIMKICVHVIMSVENDLKLPNFLLWMQFV